VTEPWRLEAYRRLPVAYGSSNHFTILGIYTYIVLTRVNIISTLSLIISSLYFCSFSIISGRASPVAAPGGKILLVTIERKGSDEEAVNKGPPFSLSEQMVRDLYEGEDWVEYISLLEQEDTFVKEPEQKSRYEGLDSLIELTFLIQAKA
jgi:hypothetical protein